MKLKGVIHISTNPAFSPYVRIGYARDLGNQLILLDDIRKEGEANERVGMPMNLKGKILAGEGSR